MGYLVEITEDKFCELTEHVEKGLKHLGKAMQFLEESRDSKYGERYHDEDEYGERYGQRGRIGNRYSRY